MFKLVAQGVSVTTGFLSHSIVSRGLGVVLFGQFVYLTDIFGKCMEFLELNSSEAFAVRTSKDFKDQALRKFYVGYALCIFAVGCLSIGFMQVFDLTSVLFIGIPGRYIWLAYIFGYFFWLAGVHDKILDAYGLSFYGAALQIVQRVSLLAGLALLFFTDLILLESVLITQTCISIFVILVSLVILYRTDPTMFNNVTISKSQMSQLAKYFWSFGADSFWVLIFSLLCVIWDRWLLNQYSGAAELGVYGFGYRLSTFTLLFSRAMRPLLTREFSKQIAVENWTYLRTIYQKAYFVLFGVGMLFGCLISVWSEKICYWVGGDKYIMAVEVLRLFAFLPAIEALNMLNVTVLFSSEKIRIYRNLAFVTLFAGPILTWWMLSPTGMSMGASGLAVKELLNHSLLLIITLPIIQKIINFSILKLVFIQVIVAVATYALAIGSYALLGDLF